MEPSTAPTPPKTYLEEVPASKQPEIPPPEIMPFHEDRLV